MEHVPGRSINLAMSHRGISALNGVGLGIHIAQEYGIPLRARMIHNPDGSTYPIPYGKDGQCIYSVGRRYINEFLLNGKRRTIQNKTYPFLFLFFRYLSENFNFSAGEKYPNLHFHFEHKLTDLDIDKAAMTFKQ